MNPNQQPADPDAFNELLSDLDRLPTTRPELADSIFAQTRGVLTRRRWFRRGRIVLACVLCYAVGIGSGWLLKPAGAVLDHQIAHPVIKLDHNAPRVTESNPGSRVHDAIQPELPTPVKARVDSTPQPSKITLQPGGSPFENFCLAGDRQLFERGNLRGAIECYRRALAHATEQQLRVAVDRDSWLLMSLKQSRQEERKHVRQKRV